MEHRFTVSVYIPPTFEGTEGLAERLVRQAVRQGQKEYFAKIQEKEGEQC